MSDKSAVDLKKSVEKEMLAVVCPACGETDDHAINCLAVELLDLESQRRNIVCPYCLEETIDLNSTGNYECRKCNSQFAKSGGRPEAERNDLEEYLIFDRAVDEIRPFFIHLLDKLGTGDFPLDKKIDGVRTAIDKMLHDA